MTQGHVIARGEESQAVLDQSTTGEAFETWYRSYSAGLKASCARLLGDDAAAQDVVQETLLRAWTRREQFTDPGQVAPWLWRVARNLCLDSLRRRKRLVVSDSMPEAPDYRADPTLGMEIEQEREAVREALGELSTRHREVLLLRDVRGLEYDELASRLGVTPNGARAVLFRARRSLRNALSSSDAFGAFVPVGVVRRAIEAIRQAGTTVAARGSARPSLAMEIAAAALAAATVLGAGGPSPQPSVPPAAGVQDAIPLPGTDPIAGVQDVLASAQQTLDGASGSVEAPEAPSAEATTPPLTDDAWYASVTVGGRKGQPETALVDVHVGLGEGQARGPVAKVLAKLPPLDLDLLQRPAVPEGGPEPVEP